MLTSKLEKEINAIWKTRNSLSSKSNKKIINTFDKTIDLIDKGKIRVAEKAKNKWKVNEWIKKAILLSFWDSKKQETLKMDLWVKDMPIDQMKLFFHQTFLSMSETFYRATKDEKITEAIRDFCDYYAEALKLK